MSFLLLPRESSLILRNIVVSQRFNFEFGTVSMAFAVARGEAFMAQFSVTTYEYPDFKTADHSQPISTVSFYLRDVNDAESSKFRMKTLARKSLKADIIVCFTYLDHERWNS
jgi:hypothetical protein